MNQLLFAALILMQGTPGAPSQDLEGRAKQAVAAQRFAEARVLYRQLAAEDPLNSDHLIWVGRISGWMGDYDTGSAALDTVLEREPRNTDALIAKAYLFLHQRRYSSAQALLDRAQAIVPESVDLRMALARNMFYQGRVKEAREQVEKVLAAEPSNSEAGQLNAQIDAQPRVYRFEMSLGFGQDRFSFASPATVESDIRRLHRYGDAGCPDLRRMEQIRRCFASRWIHPDPPLCEIRVAEGRRHHCAWRPRCSPRRLQWWLVRQCEAEDCDRW